MPMELEVPQEVMKAVQGKTKNPALQGYRSWGSETVEVAHLDDKDLDLLEKYAKPGSDKAHDRLLRKIGMVRKARSGKGAKYKTLEPMSEALRVAFGKLPNYRVYKEAGGGHFIAYLVEDCRYHSPDTRRDYYTPARIRITLKAVRRGRVQSKEEVVYTEQLAGGKTPPQLLADLGLVPETAELNEDYELQYKSYRAKRERTGSQFRSQGPAEVEQQDDEDRWWSPRRSGTVQLSHDGKPGRFIMEDDVGFGKAARDDDDEKPESEVIAIPALYQGKRKEDIDAHGVDEGTTVRLPTHPYVRGFDVRLDRYVTVHSEQLSPYRYNAGVFDKLVLSEDRKRLIDLLIKSAGAGVDVVEGKGRGVVVLLSGPPGVGKTMTAEVYSEKVLRPLYSVQCSQLGTTPDDLEKQLGTVLDRAMRWGAILLLDEAEVYIRERGEDVHQNAIVGVFLRLLEYYQGVLFMTTNREEDVDDAIKSRLTAHVRYRNPTNNERAVLWKMFAANAGVELSGKDTQALINAFPSASGRSIRNMVRLAAVMAEQADKPLDARGIQWVAQFLDVEKAHEG